MSELDQTTVDLSIDQIYVGDEPNNAISNFDHLIEHRNAVNDEPSVDENEINSFDNADNTMLDPSTRLEYGGHSRVFRSRLLSPTVATLHQQWAKEKREPERKWVCGHVAEPASHGIIPELPPPPTHNKRFELVSSRLQNPTTATLHQRKPPPPEPRQKPKDAPISEESGLLHITAAVKNGSRSRVEEKKTIHPKSFCPAASPTKPACPMADLTPTKSIAPKAYESVTSRLFKPTKAFVNAKYVPPEPVVETIRDLPGSKAKLDVASKLLSPTAATVHGQYVAAKPQEPIVTKQKPKRIKRPVSPSHSIATNSIVESLGPPLPARYCSPNPVSSLKSKDDAAFKRLASPVRRQVEKNLVEHRSRSVPRPIPRTSHLLEPTTAAAANRYIPPEPVEEMYENYVRDKMKRALAPSVQPPKCASLNTASFEYFLREGKDQRLLERPLSPAKHRQSNNDENAHFDFQSDANISGEVTDVPSYMVPTTSSRNHGTIDPPAVEASQVGTKVFNRSNSSFMQPTISSLLHFEDNSVSHSAAGVSPLISRIQLSPDERREAQTRLMQSTISYELKKKVVDVEMEPINEDTSWYDVDKEEEGIFYGDEDEDEEEVQHEAIELPPSVDVVVAKFSSGASEQANIATESLDSQSSSLDDAENEIGSAVTVISSPPATANRFFGGIDFEGTGDGYDVELSRPLSASNGQEIASDFLSSTVLVGNADVWREVPETDHGVEAESADTKKAYKRKTSRKSHRVSYEKRAYLQPNEFDNCNNSVVHENSTLIEPDNIELQQQTIDTNGDAAVSMQSMNADGCNRDETNNEVESTQSSEVIPEARYLKSTDSCQQTHSVSTNLETALSCDVSDAIILIGDSNMPRDSSKGSTRTLILTTLSTAAGNNTRAASPDPNVCEIDQQLCGSKESHVNEVRSPQISPQESDGQSSTKKDGRRRKKGFPRVTPALSADECDDLTQIG